MLATDKIEFPLHQETSVLENKKPGLGTFVGVFVPSILMVFGVIIFLRLGWIVGQAGLASTLIIITIATLIALTTTLSMASISTNLSVGKGGVYYLLSRSLGIEIGSAIGIPLYLKQCLSIAFCVIGFAESLHDLVPAMSITSIGLVTSLVLTLLAYFSLSGALKVQVAIFVILIGSLISLFMGGNEMLPVSTTAFTPESFQPLGFWAIFAIFFPAITGIESSVSLSGDLKNPGRSLPLGTISAILVGYAVYMIIPVFLAYHIPQDQLINDPFIMQAVAKVPALIVLGIWGATISSALGGLLGAPRTLQALADDGVVPRIFGRTFGKGAEPRLATLVTCLIALGGIYFGSVNLIAPLLTMICLICYAVLNFSAGLETLIDNPSWRPRFRIHWSISIMGAALCLMAMVMIDAGYAILAICLIVVMYTIAKRRSIQYSWDDIRQGILLFFSRFAVYCLAHLDGNSKSWRPHFLVFAKKEEEALLHFSQAITRNKGFITVASYVSLPIIDEQAKKNFQEDFRIDLKSQNIHALVHVAHTDDMQVNMLHMIENYGLGPLTPNTILFGSNKHENLDNLGMLIRSAYQKHRNILIFKSKMDNFDAKLPAGDIHIWWHPGHKLNGEFMLVLAYMLKRNPQWKKAKICLKKLVSCELERSQAFAEAQALSIAQRMPLQIEILVTPNPEGDYTKYIQNFSSQASLVFLSLAPPKRAIAPNDYALYLKNMMKFTQELPDSVLVLSSKFTPLENILN